MAYGYCFTVHHRSEVFKIQAKLGSDFIVRAKDKNRRAAAVIRVTRDDESLTRRHGPMNVNWLSKFLDGSEDGIDSTRSHWRNLLILTLNFNFCNLFEVPSGWDAYYFIFLAAALSLSIPLALSLVSFLISPRKNERKERLIGPPALSKDWRINSKFFMAANAALVLIAISMILIPCVGSIQPTNSPLGLRFALISIISIAALSALGLVYSARKGDLSE